MAAVIRCDRCGRRQRNPYSPEGSRWNGIVKRGVIVGYLCPDCQSPDENAEALDNLATLDYAGQGEDGLLRARKRSEN